MEEADDSWGTVSLLDIADYKNGLAMQKFRPEAGDGGLPVLKIKELGQGCCGSDVERCRSDIDERVTVHDGDLIFSWSGTLLLKFWAGGDAGLNQHLFKVTSALYPSWFYYAWTKRHLARFIMLAKDRATTMGHIKRSALAESKVILSPKGIFDEQTRFMQPIVNQLIENEVENQKLVALRDALLPKLMSGEIDVSKVDLTQLNSHLAVRLSICFGYSFFEELGGIMGKQFIEPLRDLGELKRGKKRGIYKKWITNDECQHMLLCAYLQKIAYCIQDFNATIQGGFDTSSREDVVYLLVLTDWICDAMPQLRRCIRTDVMASFAYSAASSFDEMHGFFSALRSFALSHPSSTDRHKHFHLDGNYICTDISGVGASLRFWKTGFFRLTPLGLIDTDAPQDTDVVLSVYSKKEGAQVFQHICFDMNDVRSVAEQRIDYLYELDRYMSKQLRRDYLTL